MPVVLIFWISASTRWMVGMLCPPRRISTMPCTMSSLSSWPAIPRRGWLPVLTVATSDTSTGEPLLDASMVLRISSIDWIRPMPRTTADWAENSTVWPPTLTLALFSAVSTCGTVRPYWTSLAWSIATSNVLVLPPQPFTSATPGTALNRRSSIQSSMVLRSVTE